ncbi:hypothetical protein [Paenibacillus polymyxa]|uniref:hypothetical protein n=1 Tax=Paenibacillus polymyxa TaxID=1406 RepID=UPI00058A1823|nr:hypothetical protein [Paenibacillus polymyxa]AJE52945.1 hypothetical protein RE92_18820 [Paenibacillus polymyxa]QOH63218.1 hypothetical protein DI243_18175 [Paenibacillus polymyxa]
MTEHWDEFFLKLHHQQILKEQLSTAENDESWMMISIEEAIEEILKGSLTLTNEQEIRFQTLPVFENQVTISLPDSLAPEVRTGQTVDPSRSFVVQDKLGGILFGLHQSGQELDTTQIEVYQQQMIEQTSRAQPSMKLVDDKILSIQNTIIGCYEAIFLVSPSPYYQIVFVRSWRGKAMIGSCQFKLEDAPLWVPLTYAMLHTATWSELS